MIFLAGKKSKRVKNQPAIILEDREAQILFKGKMLGCIMKL